MVSLAYGRYLHMSKLFPALFWQLFCSHYLCLAWRWETAATSWCTCHVKAGAQFNEPKLYSPSREIFLRCPLYAMQCRHIDSAEDPWSIGASFTKSPQKMVKRRSFRFLWKLLDRSVRLLVPSRNLHFAWETGRWSQLFWCPSAILAMCSSLIDR